MRVFGFFVPNRKLAKAVMKGFAGAVGAVMFYAIVVAVIYVWYRTACGRSGTCVSSFFQSALSYRPSSAIMGISGATTHGEVAAPPPPPPSQQQQQQQQQRQVPAPQVKVTGGGMTGGGMTGGSEDVHAWDDDR